MIFCWIFGKGCSGNQQAKENERLRNYAEYENKVINKSAAAGQEFDQLKQSVKDMTRDDAAAKFQQVVDKCKQVLADIDPKVGKVEMPEKAAGLQALLQMVMELRATGTENYKNALLDVLDKKPVDDATAKMSTGLFDLVVSDNTLQRYRATMAERLREAKFGFVKVADSVYMPKADEALAASVSAYIGQISGTEGGNQLHGVAVVGIQTTPARVDMTGSGIAILPNSKSFTVKVSVQNQGNQEEDQVAVVATLDTEPEGTTQKKTQKITRLKAGETYTLVFEDLVPATGSEKENILKVTAGPVAGEKKVDNNTMELRFIMRADAG